MGQSRQKRHIQKYNETKAIGNLMVDLDDMISVEHHSNKNNTNAKESSNNIESEFVYPDSSNVLSANSSDFYHNNLFETKSEDLTKPLLGKRDYEFINNFASLGNLNKNSQDNSPTGFLKPPTTNKLRFFTVKEDYLMMFTYKQTTGDLTVFQMSQDLSLLLPNRSAEAIRDRIKRYISKLNVHDEIKIMKASKITPDYFIHWKNCKEKNTEDSEKHIDYIGNNVPGTHSHSIPDKTQFFNQNSDCIDLTTKKSNNEENYSAEHNLISHNHVDDQPENYNGFIIKDDNIIIVKKEHLEEDFKEENIEVLSEFSLKKLKIDNGWTSTKLTNEDPKKDYENKVLTLISMLYNPENEILKRSDILTEQVTVISNRYVINTKQIISSMTKIAKQRNTMGFLELVDM